MESSSGTNAELEGSTLGRKSRDDSQPNLRASRNQTSGGFLLDSAYSRNSRHAHAGSASQYTQRTQGTNSEKRRHADDELIVPKKRSPSYRGTHERSRSLRASPLAAVTNISASEGHDSCQNEYATSRHASSRNSYSSNVGLDTDPVQIVNLALNLSESRRRTTVGRTPSSPLPGIPRNPSNNQVLFSTSDNAHRPLAGNKVQRHSSLYMQDNRHARNTRPLTPPLAHEPSANTHGAAAGIGPILDLKDVEMACSQATLVRIQKAKQHFELFSKYLELLSYLPPLKNQAYSGARPAAGRAYNPLQAIRNRKTRLREKNVINLESEGWQDVSRVGNWLGSVEATHEKDSEDPYECLALPPYPNSHHDDRMIEQQELWHTRATSPSSSARGTNRSGTKIQRPRLEWAISPAELLADAVWLEYGSNKAKAVDRDGEKLYPDPTKLKLALPVSYAGHPDSAYQNRHALAKEPTTPSAFNKTARETISVHGYQWPKSHSAQSMSNEATGIFAPKWTRSNSLSDDSSSDDIISRGRSRRANRRKKIKSEAAMQAEKLHRVLKAHSDSSNTKSRHSNSLSHPSSAKTGKFADKTSLLISPGGSVTGKEDRRMSGDEMDSTAPNSPMQGTMFPSITANLSPPSSRSPSPRKKLPRVIESLQERTRYRRHSHVEQGERLDESPSESSQARNRTAADSIPKENESPKFLEPSPIPEPSYSQEDMSLDDIRRSDVPKPYTSHESRLKGFLKNSRIAEIVGSEVSKVGDLIRRKEGGGHSRYSSYASSTVSDDGQSDEEGSDGDESIPSKQASLRRGSTFSDDEWGFPWRKSSGRAPAKSFSNNIPPIGPTDNQNELAESDSLQQQRSDASRVSDVHFVPAHPRLAPKLASSIDTTPYSERRDSYGFRASSRDQSPEGRPKLQAVGNEISTPSIRIPGPPVTGLANAEASRTKRPTLSTGSHGWTLSDRSIPTVDDPNIVEKREVLRYKAFLLSSGIKASALVHRFEEPRNHTPPQFLLQSLADKDKPLIIPRLSRIDEFNYAARNLLERLETTKTNLNKTMYRFSKSTLLPLERELDILEDLINNSLTPRVRTAAREAESLSTQLNTTSTLAIKQLSDTLDKGLRKRNRRLRSIRRIGFMLLEWVLVGGMWWVWLIVMVFKVIRGIGMGVVKSIRWVLWV
ncbi:hypothetical protein UA08_00138 [Talaromyces atroroseus]|uniref:Uncharacterized protein n=1 Tax=Talaromyces atroroseus TaxID=1441469 RepID=A0A225AY63_TALAT|nr:hypothetical protein UA08_00138 [Talaromyces atroroseus]OKL64573.1 hypothetical protein UA08_00138 [Talaromyces atroroseus]